MLYATMAVVIIIVAVGAVLANRIGKKKPRTVKMKR